MLMNKGFARNVLTLLSGTVMAQGLLLAVLPVLTRFYSAEQFGYFGIYSAAVGLLAIFVNVRLDLGVISAESDERAAAIVIFSISCSMIAGAVLCGLALLVFVGVLLSMGKTFYFWIIAIPIAAAANAIFNTLSAWHNRRCHYRMIANNRIVQSILVIALQLCFVWLFPLETGLIVGGFLAYLLTILWWCFQTWKSDRNCFVVVKREDVIENAKSLKSFAAKAVSVDVLSQLLYQLPLAFLGYLFSPVAMGYYTLTQRVLGVPSGIIGGSIAEVFRQRATDVYSKTRNCKVLYVKTFRTLAIIAMSIGIPLFIFLPDIFAFAFGSGWRDAGLFAQILLPVFLLKFVSHPLAYLIILANRLDFEIKVHIVMLIALLAGMSALGITGISATGILIFYTITYMLCYLSYLVFSYRLSHGN